MKKIAIILVILILLVGCSKAEVYTPQESFFEDTYTEIESFESTSQELVSSAQSDVSSATNSTASTSKPIQNNSSNTTASKQNNSKTNSSKNTVSKSEKEEIAVKEKAGFSNGLWLSYIEIRDLLKTPETFKTEFAKVIENCKKLKITQLYIHVHSHCDSIFKSDYYPLTKEAKKYNYDVFEYMISQCKRVGIKVHAWINPYRVSATTEDVKTLSKSSPAYIWLNDRDEQNDRNVVFYNGIYLNPGEAQVRKLVVDGIKEIINKYSVSGIHFDDYFYPTTKKELDSVSYKAYCESTEVPLKLAAWRRSNVDTLVSDCRTAIDLLNKKIIFSISPAASIKMNYRSYYADIEGWVKKGYLDEIIPQLYFGFKHPQEEFKFDNLLNEWIKLSQKNEKVKLTIGLAAYKIGTESKSDGTEWKKNTDILARQRKLCYKFNDVDGVVYFSYSSLFSSKKANIAERKNIIKVMNSN